MTNYERIKNMSVEEMAEELYFTCPRNKQCVCKTMTCVECWIEWLESEVKHG